MYTNAEKLTAVITHWLRPMSDMVTQLVLKDKFDGINEWAKKMFPLPSDYSITNDLSFLFKPTLNNLISPAIKNMLNQSGIEDCAIPSWAHQMVSAMQEEVSVKGSITLFDFLMFHPEDIYNLKHLVDVNFPDVDYDIYKVME